MGQLFKELSSTLINPNFLYHDMSDIVSFFSYKMKMSSLFLIAAGVIALGAVTAALEIEILKRDIAAPEDESKLLAEDPAGEASLLAQLTGWLAQLTRREAEAAGGIGFGAADAAGGSDNGAAGGSDYGAAGAAGSDYVAAGGSYYGAEGAAGGSDYSAADLCDSHGCIHGTCEVWKDGDTYDDYAICDCEPGYDGEFCDEEYASPKVAKPKILVTGICASSPQLPCCEETIYIYKLLNEIFPPTDLEFPACRSDGYYAAKQCHPERGCYCVDENGWENHGKEDQPENHWDIECAQTQAFQHQVSPVFPEVKSGWDAFKSLWNVVQKSAEELGHQVDTQTTLLEQLQYSLENADESKLLAEDPAGEASLLAQLTRQEAEAAGGIGFGAADGSDNGAAGGSDYGAAGAAGGSDYVAAGGSYYGEAGAAGGSDYVAAGGSYYGAEGAADGSDYNAADVAQQATLATLAALATLATLATLARK